MIFTAATYGQQSMDYYGLPSNVYNSRFRLNSFESNADNYNGSKDWELSVSLSGVNDENKSGNINAISFSKRIAEHYLYARYTPGYRQQFIFNSGVKLVIGDDIDVETVLKTHLDYQEKFGFGYSYQLIPELNAGFSFRYFTQEFEEEVPEPFFSDTLNYIATKTETTTSNFWRGDLGITYSPSENFRMSVSSINLFTPEETSTAEIAKNFSIKKTKGFAAQLSLMPFEKITTTAVYESSNSFLLGGNFAADFLGGTFTFGASVFHDKYQHPFIAGVSPFINFSTELYGITFSGVKYLNDRQAPHTVSDLLENGVHNLLNNNFSYDRLTLSINVALSFLPAQSVKFVDVELKNEIYPTLGDVYLNNPFAVARAVNLTDKTISVKPYSFINEINSENVYSPVVNILPYDTTNIPFFTVINPENLKIKRREIAQANFYLTINGGNVEDQFQKPVLVNDLNSWDGNVYNLRYFVKRDLSFANQYSKIIIKEKKSEIESGKYKSEIMNQVKIIFDDFVKKMKYISDPRASVETVQFPQETLQLKGGDCDDLSVCFASLLEGIGIQTAFVDYKNTGGVAHVNLFFNTGLTPEEMSLITNNDNKIVVRKNLDGIDELWIPVETTSLTDFETAWSVAAEMFNREAVENLGLAKGSVVIVDIN